MVYKHNIIGKQVSITQANNKHLVGTTGVLIDETAKTVVIQTPQGQKRVMKTKDIVFVIETTTLSGTQLQKRPEERIRSKT